MNVLRVLPVVITILVLSTGLQGGEKTDVAKLISGDWEVVKTSPGGLPVGSVFDFGKEGKLKLALQEEGQVHKANGTYKLDGNKLAIVVNWSSDKQTKQAFVIKKISAKEMTIEDEKGKGVEFKRK